MKNNKDIIIICSIIALCILAIDIILTMIAGLYTFSSILLVLFIIAVIALIIFAIKKQPKKEVKKSIINNIEDTIALKLEDLKSDSITTIRTKKEIEIINDQSIEKDLEVQRENNVTKEKIEEELSKTVFINDLKEKIKQFEEEQEIIKQQEEEKELKELNKLIKQRKND